MSDPTPPPTPQLPRLRLDFFDTALIMTRREENGQTTSYPVAVQELVSACTEITLARANAKRKRKTCASCGGN